MNGVLGEILGLALGIAISPVPIIAAILMLLSPSGKASGAAFLVGWIVGIAGAVVLFTYVGGLLPSDDGSAQPVRGVIRLLIAVGLLALAVRQWRSRPADGETPEMPKWMAAVDTFTPAKAAVMGAALSALNPKNLGMAIAAGVAVSKAGLDTGDAAVVLAIWVAFASVTILVPVVAAFVSGEAIAVPLEIMRSWLVANNTTVMSVLLLVLGVNLLGSGIGSF